MEMQLQYLKLPRKCCPSSYTQPLHFQYHEWYTCPKL